MPDFDVFVIGAGSGGVRFARIAAQNGAKVAIAESRHWGGTCVNLGCVPKKLMVYASEGAEAAEDARAYGWDIKTGAHDWQKLIAAKDKEIERLDGIYKSMLGKAGVELFIGRAKLIDANTIEIGPGPLDEQAEPRRVTAKRIVIATGGRPTRPPIEGAEHAIISDQAFHLKARPERICIIGGGYIGVEFAGIFAGLGSQVDLVFRQDLPLRGFDQELREKLHEALPHHGITVHAGQSPERIEKLGESSYRVTLGNGESIETGLVFFATGRKPNIDGLGLEAVGVTLKNGAVAVDERSATNIANIFAIGDVTDRINLTPVAIAEGHILAETLYAGQARSWSFETTPKAVFFSETLASVGLTEEEAVGEADIEVFTAAFRPLRQTLIGRDRKAFMKLIVERESQKVVGAHMMGDAAAEMMQGIAIAVTAGLKKIDFDRTIGIHPTTAEEFVTMRTPTRQRERTLRS
ncbi:glutathione-disulfide reductase [Asaia sp. W19]|uniref:glutathione-disulfide reductase n=1 Tax=unclassified Asaia TaxID=2685023 RepID=UPI000F8DF193|nr:glutathione-disulfide reductase [Asaia sp. W19]RUT27033.1 glutathione-disulfide reductase [Asaia sp. W19]